MSLGLGPTFVSYPSTAAERWRHSSVESGANLAPCKEMSRRKMIKKSLMTYWLHAMPAEKCTHTHTLNNNPMATPWSADNAHYNLGDIQKGLSEIQVTGIRANPAPSKEVQHKIHQPTNAWWSCTSPLKPRATGKLDVLATHPIEKTLRKTNSKSPWNVVLGKRSFPFKIRSIFRVYVKIQGK